MSKEKVRKDPIKFPKPKVEYPYILDEKDGVYLIVKLDHSWVLTFS